MYKSHKDEAIVIKSINYSEADKILTLFGKYTGKFSVIAKGIRRIESKNRGNLQTLFISEVYFLERGSSDLGILKESRLLYASDYSKESLRNVQRVLFMLNKFIPFKQPETEVYNQVHELVKKGFSLGNVNDFRIFTLRQLGFLGEEGTCQRCDRVSDKILVHPRSLELICEDCFEKVKGSEDKEFFKNDVETRYYEELLADQEGMASFLDSYVNSIVF